MADKNDNTKEFFNQYFPVLVCGNVFMGSVLGHRTTLGLLDGMLAMAGGMVLGLLVIPFLLAYLRKSFPAKKVGLGLCTSFLLIQLLILVTLESCSTSHPAQLFAAILMGFNTGMFGRGLARSFS